jgi:hypothetical protein
LTMVRASRDVALLLDPAAVLQLLAASAARR